MRFCSSLETYPDHLDVIVIKEYEELFSDAFLRYLIQNGKDWDLMKLDGVHENSTIKKYWTSTPPKMKGLFITSVPDAKCPYLVID